MTSRMSGKAAGGNFQRAGDPQNQATCLSYDAAGNVIANAPAAYTYDQENRISSTAGMTYIYDANGNRVEKTGVGSGTLYWYGAPGILAESDLAGNLKSEYVFFGSKRVARIDSPGNSVHYYLSDHLNSTSMVVSAAGTVEEESDYSPFGTEYTVTSTGANHYKFTGKERDAETCTAGSCLDYFGARYYSNGLGRFITPDPLMIQKQKLADPQQWNMFSYVRNNPLLYVDPDGRELKMVVFLEGGKGNDTYTRNGVMRAANAIHNVGVKNVTVEFRSGKPDSKTLAGLNKGHVIVFRVQGPSDKSVATKAMEALTESRAFGQSEKTTNVVHLFPSGSGIEGMETREISNVVKHEMLHQAGESFVSDFTSNEPGNVMDPDSYNKDLEWKDLEIDPSYQGLELRSKFNRPNELDRTPNGATCVGGCPEKKTKKESQ